MNRNHKENLKARNIKEVSAKYKKDNYKEIIVKKDNELLAYLIEDLGYSRTNAKALLSHHLISIGGAPVSQFNLKIYKGDTLIIAKHPIKKKERDNLPIIYEDNDIIVINKPAGLLTVASDNEKSNTAFRMVNDYLQEKDKRTRIFVVHRIDKETSGVLMFAKSRELQEILQDKWNEVVKKRGYFAIVEKPMEKEEETITNYLMMDSTNRMYVSRPNKKAQKCITKYKVINSNKKYSLLDVTIFTGRKNQIRVTLDNIGHTVVGDDKYGDPDNPIHRLCLHAYELSITNPITNKLYKFNAPIPKEFNALISK